MGRAIDMENKLHSLEIRVKLVEDALEEMIQTRVHHVDLTDERDVKAEGVVIRLLLLSKTIAQKIRDYLNDKYGDFTDKTTARKTTTALQMWNVQKGHKKK